MNPLLDKSLVETLTGAVMLVLPEVTLLGVACVLLVLGLALQNRTVTSLVALFGILAAALVTLLVQADEADTYTKLISSGASTYAPILPGALAEYTRWLTLAVGLVFVLLCAKETTRDIGTEYLACWLVILAGTSLVGRANDLTSLYLALEMISVPTYVLLYLPARGKNGQEAAAKYFLLSILSSGVMLFGMSYLYGLTGTTNLVAMHSALATAHSMSVSPLATLAMVLVLAGLAFRITAVPFHYYAPDVYQGGPLGVVAQLAVIPKIAGFIAIARLLGMTQLPLANPPFPVSTQIPLMLWVLAAITMSVGNVMALLQDNLRRIMAYSGVSHAGYMLLGLVTVSASGSSAAPVGIVNGLDAILFYLAAYALMTLAFFSVLAYLQSTEHPIDSLDDLAGVGQTHPYAAVLLLVSLLSMIGFPFLAGFWGKFQLFYGVFNAPSAGGMGSMYRLLALVAAVNAAIGAVYYLRIVGMIYLRSPLRSAPPAQGVGPLIAATLCTIGTLVVGFYPQPLTDATQLAAPVGKSPTTAR